MHTTLAGLAMIGMALSGKTTRRRMRWHSGDFSFSRKLRKANSREFESISRNLAINLRELEFAAEDAMFLGNCDEAHRILSQANFLLGRFGDLMREYARRHPEDKDLAQLKYQGMASPIAITRKQFRHYCLKHDVF